MSKKIVTVFLLLFLLGLSSVMATAQSPQGKVKLRVITTLFPTYDFTKQIGKDKVEVSLLLPPSVEAHTFEPKPSDIVKIHKADVFIYTGKYMEPWVEDMLKGISNKNLAVVDASSGIELAAEDDHYEYDERKKGEHREDGNGHNYIHYHNGKDPHIWLDFGDAQIMVNTIVTALAQKDPANSEFYLRNAKDYNEKLADLDERFKNTLSACKYKKIVHGGHFAFGYLARRYGLKYISPYEGFSPNAEPTPKAIAQLINTLKQTGMRCIYYEELLNPKVARTISQETGARLELLHGAHNISKDELKQGVTFLQIMEENLEKLKIGLECSPR